mmetsp:Transcript_19274/g.54093  ORF Transcript_19274/g.54093 Transcript_19274/m.54093 type:complete len:294 (-) Transcript_19274:232-1113(-)
MTYRTDRPALLVTASPPGAVMESHRRGFSPGGEARYFTACSSPRKTEQERPRLSVTAATSARDTGQCRSADCGRSRWERASAAKGAASLCALPAPVAVRTRNVSRTASTDGWDGRRTPATTASVSQPLRALSLEGLADSCTTSITKSSSTMVGPHDMARARSSCRREVGVGVVVGALDDVTAMNAGKSPMICISFMNTCRAYMLCRCSFVPTGGGRMGQKKGSRWYPNAPTSAADGDPSFATISRSCPCTSVRRWRIFSRSAPAPAAAIRARLLSKTESGGRESSSRTQRVGT